MANFGTIELSAETVAELSLPIMPGLSYESFSINFYQTDYKESHRRGLELFFWMAISIAACTVLFFSNLLVQFIVLHVNYKKS
ncbi:hypothetical protein A9Q99_10250 [Gammaproteobacteria bacterium 45_16_T64]|nr:hypothetical protein A9Q99_10250 [Gammaproteobacteria bacterium 45_16_T64]